MNTTLNNVIKILKTNIEEKRYLNVGVGSEKQLCISRTKLKTAMVMLIDEGYHLYYVPVLKPNTEFKNTIMVLTGPSIEYEEVCDNKDNIKYIKEKVEI
jgi:hypothetical protein